MFSAEFQKKSKELLSSYPKKVHALLPLLHLVQKEKGYIDSDAIQYLSKLCDTSFNHIQGVVSFYTMYTQKPRGKTHLAVCTNLSCWLKGSDNVVKAIKEKLALNDRGEDSDKKYFLEEVECLGACGYAPVVAINNRYCENFDIEQLQQLIAEKTENKERGK
jgi:NADH-quinone oxidoreductase subunit E